MSPEGKRTRLEQFEAACRERGLAVTVQRRRILELLLDRTDHPTADQVYEVAQQQLPGISRTTVYRVLDALVELGMIKKVSSPGAAVRYDPATRHHHHLVCTCCERLIDFDDTGLDAALQAAPVRPEAFQVRDISVYVYGLCAECRTKQGQNST